MGTAPYPGSRSPFIPEYLDPTVFEMIIRDTGLRDPARAVDEQVIGEYEQAKMGGYVAEYFLALLRGCAAPPRPDEEATS